MSEVGRRVPAIDALRGVAALMVLVCHLPFSASGLEEFRTDSGGNLSFFLRQQGRLGVHLFLLASGFCIHMRYAQSGELRFVPFWRRRLTRLYPPYIFVAALSLVSVVLLGRYRPEWPIAVDAALLALLLQNLTRAPWRIGNGPLWTLALEEQLYLLYFPLVQMRKRLSWSVALRAVLMVTLLWRIAGETVVPTEIRFAWFLIGPSRWFEWSLGALAAEVYVSPEKAPAWSRSPWAFALALFLAEGADQLQRVPSVGAAAHVLVEPLYGIAFFVLVNLLLASTRESVSNSLLRVAALVGTMSYSLYLVHVPVMGLAKVLALRASFPSWAIVALRVILPLAVGALFYRLIERPFLMRSRKLG